MKIFKKDDKDDTHVETRIEIEPAALAHLSMLSEEERKAVHEILRSMSEDDVTGNVFTEKEYLCDMLDDWFQFHQSESYDQ